MMRISTEGKESVGERIDEIGTPDSNVGRGREEETEKPNGETEKFEAVEDSGDGIGERGKNAAEMAPVDDCCPICFGTFTIPCRTNCGHWFCASCIMQFWNYKAALQQCKCPICCRPICNLTPDSSFQTQQEEDVVKLLKNIEGYNRLFLSGPTGLVMKVIELPLVIRRLFRGLMDPDRFRLNYYTVRFVAWMLSFLYNISRFDFIPTGGLGIRRLFDICAIALVVVLSLVGLCNRYVLRRVLRRRTGLLAAA